MGEVAMLARLVWQDELLGAFIAPGLRRGTCACSIPYRPAMKATELRLQGHAFADTSPRAPTRGAATPSVARSVATRGQLRQSPSRVRLSGMADVPFAVGPTPRLSGLVRRVPGRPE